jgi:hypothetical protein
MLNGRSRLIGESETTERELMKSASQVNVGHGNERCKIVSTKNRTYMILTEPESLWTITLNALKTGVNMLKHDTGQR